MADVDVAVIGGGPAGYSAALRAAEAGASVAVIEAERPGGSCVHHACIPTNILLGAVATFLDARELAVMGVFEAGEQWNLGRAAARKSALVNKMTDGIVAALRMHKVRLIPGRATFRDESTLSIAADGGTTALSAEAIIIATGTRWVPPSIPGLSQERLLTADNVQGLVQVPSSAVVLAGGPAETAFALEYATLLAVAGSNVTVVQAGARLLPGLDTSLSEAAARTLTDLGINVFTGAALEGHGTNEVMVVTSQGQSTVAAEIVVAADVRRPFFEGLALDAAGVQAETHVIVDRSCRTNRPTIFAAGDVTGGAMLTNAAIHMGEVAGTNATGGAARTSLGALPHVIHTYPGIGWIGLTEEGARAAGHDVVTGIFDLSYNARAITIGAREGLVKVVADRKLGEVLGVHAVGPEVAEILAVATVTMQAEIRLQDLAAMIPWHPSVSEGLVEAARRAVRGL